MEKKKSVNRVKPFHEIKDNLICLEETQAIQRTKKDELANSLRKVQAKKSTRRMPWHQEPKKDVTSCDKPRGAANKRYIRGFPNGETLTVKNRETYTEYIGIRGEPPELKHLSRERKRNQPRFRE